MPRSRCAAVPVVRAALGPEVKQGFMSEVDQHNSLTSQICEEKTDVLLQK